MTYFTDLSDYEYFEDYIRPNTINVGWLAKDHCFKKNPPTESDLDLVWDMCRVLVAKTRGLHRCEFCDSNEHMVSERKGTSLLLGASEIRVFSPDGTIYAAPNLIFHYMAIHQYEPPPQFLYALRNGIKPLTEQYFQRLKGLDLEYNVAHEANSSIKTFRLSDLPD
jgi:hypothetical protein